MTLQFREVAVLLVVLIAGVWAVLWWWSAHGIPRMSRRERTPLTPWQRLCHAHELTQSDRELLTKLAQAAGLADPLLVFVDPRVLEEAVSNGPDSNEFVRLGQQLFGDTFQSAA